MTKIYITETKQKDHNDWELIGFYTHLPYLKSA